MGRITSFVPIVVSLVAILFSCDNLQTNSTSTDTPTNDQEWTLFTVVTKDDSTKLVNVDHQTGEQTIVAELTQSADTNNEALTFDPQSGSFLSTDPWDDDNQSDSSVPTEISRINVQQGTSGIIATIPHSIGGIAYSSDGQLYGLSKFGNSLGLIDLSENDFDSIDIDLEPLDGDFRFWHFDIAPDGNAYIIARETNEDNTYLVTVDLLSAAVTSQILLIDEEDGEPLSLSLGDVAYGSDGNLYAANYSSLVVRIVPDTGLVSWLGWSSVGSFSNLASGSAINE